MDVDRGSVWVDEVARLISSASVCVQEDTGAGFEASGISSTVSTGLLSTLGRDTTCLAGTGVDDRDDATVAGVLSAVTDMSDRPEVLSVCRDSVHTLACDIFSERVGEVGRLGESGPLGTVFSLLDRIMSSSNPAAVVARAATLGSSSMVAMMLPDG